MRQLELAPPDDAIWPEFVRREVKPIRIVFIDDHPVVREGVSALLGLEEDMVMVADVGDLDTGIDLVRSHEPDLVICDLNMPGSSGCSAVRKLRSEFPNVRVLVLSALDSLECIRESFAAGAIGYVRKDALRADLLAAVRRAAAGAQAICLGVSDVVMRNWLLEAEATSRAASTPLEPEDRQVLRLIALGVPTWRIAVDLGRGVKAVEKYRVNLMRRLNLNSTAAVTRYAVSCNLLSREELDQLVPSE